MRQLAEKKLKHQREEESQILRDAHTLITIIGSSVHQQFVS
jgi:hypothetical protein